MLKCYDVRTSKELKSTFICEKYVKMLQPSSRSCIARLRSECSLWPSRQAVGVENRSTSVCAQFAHKPVVKTEEHFLLSCPLYNVIRTKHINQLITSYDWNNIFNINKMIYLFIDNFVYAAMKMMRDSFSRRIN